MFINLGDRKGKFIIVEGGDYSGKSTFINALTKENNSNFKFTREPGNKLRPITDYNLCENIRNILLSNDMACIQDQAVLFAASREIHTKDIIKLINKGYTVICDRYILSSFAYQSYAGGLDYDEVCEYNKQALEELKENDIELNILLFEVSEETYKARKLLRQQQTTLDVIEQKDKQYYNKVNDFYNKGIYKEYMPTDMVHINLFTIDANKTIEQVYEQGKEIINSIISL